jgi:hypothetical protein
MKKILIALCFLLAGCASNQIQHNTPSKKVEATFFNADESVICGMITEKMIDKGYFVKNSGNKLLVFDRPIEGVLAGMVYGSRYDSTPNSRVSYSINTYDGKTRVVVSFAVITNPGSGYEKTTPFDNHKDTIEYKVMLDNMKARLSK